MSQSFMTEEKRDSFRSQLRELNETEKYDFDQLDPVMGPHDEVFLSTKSVLHKKSRVYSISVRFDDDPEN